MLTPADIDSKQFATTRLREGYDQDEVDTFLDQVGADYSAALQRVAEAEQKAAALQARLDRMTDSSTVTMPPVPTSTPSAEGILRLAQQTADQHVQQAQVEAQRLTEEAAAKADQVVREAGAQGAKAIEDAQVAAERIKSEGTEARAQVIAEHEARKAQLATDVNALQDKATYYRTWLKNSLAAFERELGNGPAQ